MVICASCYEEVRDLVEARCLGAITLRGVRDPVTVYEITGEKA